MADPLEILRQDALQKRIHGVAGGLQVRWSAGDAARIHDHVMALKPERLVARDMRAASHKQLDIAGIRAKSDVKAASPSDLAFLFVISSQDVDLMGDVVTVAGINTANFVKNPVVLDSHNSGATPVAISTTPAVSGAGMIATAQFPQPGISESSDQVAAAVRAKLVRGASIGFVPLRWSFSKDPSRPMGVDFHECPLLEWSICAVPANPSCLLLGPVASGKSASNCDRERPQLKSGRRISAANEALLRKAMDHHDCATKCIKDVLDSNTSADDDPDDPYDHGDNSDVIPAPEERRRREARVAEAREFRVASLLR